MNQHTQAEIRGALETLERILGRQKTYTRRDLDGMSAEQVAEVLAEQPDAFDHVEEADES